MREGNIIVVTPLKCVINPEILGAFDNEKSMVYLEEPKNNINLVKYEDDYKFLQKQVGGILEHYVMSVELDEMKIDCWINDEGKLLGLEPNFCLEDNEGNVLDYIVGNVVFSSFNSQGETLPLTEFQQRKVIEWIASLDRKLVKLRKTSEVYAVYRVPGFRRSPF